MENDHTQYAVSVRDQGGAGVVAGKPEVGASGEFLIRTEVLQIKTAGVPGKSCRLMESFGISGMAGEFIKIEGFSVVPDLYADSVCIHHSLQPSVGDRVLFFQMGNAGLRVIEKRDVAVSFGGRFRDHETGKSHSDKNGAGDQSGKNSHLDMEFSEHGRALQFFCILHIIARISLRNL